MSVSLCCVPHFFSHFLYNNQKYHRKIRLSIVENITEKWDNYTSFIIGSCNDILDGNDYKRFMSKNCIYGGDIEIKSFSELYNVRVTVYFENSNIFHNFGDSQNNDYQLKLLFSGNLDNGHYDILEYQNINVKCEKEKRKQNNCYKRKIDNNNYDNLQIDNKRLKLTESFSALNVNKHKRSKKKLEYESYFANMSYVCEFCSAVYWKEEKNKSICCSKGKIVLSPLSTYNKTLENHLMYDNKFRTLIRYYNNLFCFATFSANVKYENKKAIYNLKIQGQVCHITPNTLLPKKKESLLVVNYIYMMTILPFK